MYSFGICGRAAPSERSGGGQPARTLGSCAAKMFFNVQSRSSASMELSLVMTS